MDILSPAQISLSFQTCRCYMQAHTSVVAIITNQILNARRHAKLIQINDNILKIIDNARHI